MCNWHSFFCVQWISIIWLGKIPYPHPLELLKVDVIRYWVWVRPNIYQNVCDNLRRAFQFRSKEIAERRESVTLIEWINLWEKKLDRSPFTFLNRVWRHLRNYSCFCPVTQRAKAKVDLPLDGFFNKSLPRSKIKQNKTTRSGQKKRCKTACTWTHFLLHPMEKKKKSLVKYHSPRTVTLKLASRQEVVITYSCWVVKLSNQIAPLYHFSLGMSYTCWYEHTVVQCCTHYACNWGRLLHHDTRALNFYPFAYKSAASCVLNSATSKSRKCLVHMPSEIDSARVRSQWAVISLRSVSTAECLRHEANYPGDEMCRGSKPSATLVQLDIVNSRNCGDMHSEIFWFFTFMLINHDQKVVS